MGRKQEDNPGGIPYRLIAEACIPSINVDDIGSIFEEHRIVKSLDINVFSMDTDGNADHVTGGGVFGEEEKKFVFSSALVGVRSKARFKITNIKKVCKSAAFRQTWTLLSFGLLLLMHSVKLSN